VQKLVCRLVLAYLKEGSEALHEGFLARKGKEHHPQVSPEMIPDVRSWKGIRSDLSGLE
jgi:hypothetical protein